MARRYLILCTGNRCRSQMAHGFLQKYLPDAEVRSAGTKPKGVHPKSITMMAEVGIDISQHTSDHVDQYADDHFDAVVTVCDAAKESCPVFTNADRTIHHSFEDPDRPDLGNDAEAADSLFRKVRDEIDDWAKAFAEQERASTSQS
jgi:arsenate reductase